VASPYSLGHPSFATPAVVEVIQANAYSLGHPSFATPVLTTIQLIVHANSYSLGALGWSHPFMGQYQYLTAPASYWLGSPDIPIVAPIQQYHFFVNRTDNGPPTFDAPVIHQNHVVHANAYSLGALDMARPSPVGLVDVHLYADAYWLGSPI